MATMQTQLSLRPQIEVPCTDHYFISPTQAHCLFSNPQAALSENEPVRAAVSDQ